MKLFKDEQINFKKYKGFKYFIRDVSNYKCGYILLNKSLFDKLDLFLGANKTMFDEGKITFIKDASAKEVCIGFDTNYRNRHDDDNSVFYITLIIKNWINYIETNI